MHHIFLFGAGISAGALPLVSEWRYYATGLLLELSLNYKSKFNDVIEVGVESLRFSTPDTFAKYLYLSGANLNKQINLKKFYSLLLLSILKFSYLYERIIENKSHAFMSESWQQLDEYLVEIYTEIKNKDNSSNVFKKMQMLKNSLKPNGMVTDSRIINFATEILDLPVEQFTLLTWNYDNLFENIFKELKKDTIQISHLNGNLIDICSDISSLEDLATKIVSYDENLIEFAWEKDQNTTTVIEKCAQKVLSESGRVNLILAGYSMPYYNREMDMRLITSLSRKDRIYIQDKNPELIKERLEIYLKESEKESIPVIEIIKDISRIYIPYS